MGTLQRMTRGVVAVLLMAGWNAVQAQDSLGMQRVSTLEYWQGANDIQMIGDTAYVVSGPSGLHIMDLSDPAHPIEIGRCTWYDWEYVTGGVYVTGNRAYLGLGGGLLVFDISDPTHPVRIGRWGNPDTEIELEDIFVYGNIGIALLGESGYPFIVDLSDLGNVYVVGEFDVTRRTSPIGMANGYLYMNGIGLSVWDITDPTQPARVASADTQFVSHYATISGDYAYLSTLYDGLRIIDISDPLQPVEVGSCDSGGCGDVTAVGDYVIVSKYDYLAIWNVSDPVHPVLESTFPSSPFCVPSRVASSGYIVCAATREQRSSVVVVDVSDPAAPVEISSFGRHGVLRRTALNGTLGYLADSWAGGLRTFDFGDPTNVLELGVAAETLAYYSSYDVGGRGDYAYVAGGRDGLVIFDVSDPANPESLSCICTQPINRMEAWRINVAGDYAYVLGDSIRVYSLWNPAEPEIAGAIAGIGLAHVTANGYLYNGGGRWLRVFSLADPAAPQFVGSFELPFYFTADIEDFAVSGNYLYVAYYGGGLRILDVGDPAHLIEVNVVWESTWRVAAAGNTLITHGENGLRAWDITDPLDLSLIGHYETEEWLQQITIVGPYLLTVYVSHVRVYECDALTNTEARPETVPEKFELFPCYPNPFNPATTISFSLPQTGHTTLVVYDVAGRQVSLLVDGVLTVGKHSVMFEGTGLPSGVYFVRLETIGRAETRRVALIR
ncbi:T9SS type A sorting domain-containing protein [bacterium]|nr:T9SS type A sorting domain-containing protein [bacterium]